MTKATILVVDDDTDFVRRISPRLSFSGYDVISALEGMTALQIAVRERPDLVLLDIGMSAADGHALARRLKADPATATVPIIFFFTCRTSNEDLESAWGVQAAGYVEKPCGIETLLERIAETLEVAKPAPDDQPPTADVLPQLVQRVWAEYREMPGMCLTVPQAQRLFGITEPVCGQVLDVLFDMGHLRVADGQYVRHSGLERGVAKPEVAGVRRVLVVDDHDDFRRGLMLRLQADGFEVLAAADGVTAMLLAAREQPHVVILDVGLPGGDGYTTAKALRENPKTAEILIVFLTARAAAEDMQKAREVGAAAYLVKPCPSDDLIRKVREVLETTV